MDINAINKQHAASRVVQNRILQWDDKDKPLAKLDSVQIDLINEIEELNTKAKAVSWILCGNLWWKIDIRTNCELSQLTFRTPPHHLTQPAPHPPSHLSSNQRPNSSHSTTKSKMISSTSLMMCTASFVTSWRIVRNNAIHCWARWVNSFNLSTWAHFNLIDSLHLQIDNSLDALNKLTKEYEFVNTKTSSLNIASENLLQEQTKLNEVNEEIRFRLKHFTQAEHIFQRLQNPTFSPASEQFANIMSTIDECLDYLREHVRIHRHNFACTSCWFWFPSPIHFSPTSKSQQLSPSNTSSVYCAAFRWLRITSHKRWLSRPSKFSIPKRSWRHLSYPTSRRRLHLRCSMASFKHRQRKLRK